MIEIKSEFTGNGVETKIKLSGDRFEILLEIAGTLTAIHKKTERNAAGRRHGKGE